MKYSIRKKFKGKIEYIIQAYSLIDSFMISSFILFLWFLITWAGYKYNPKYVGMFDSYLEYITSSGFIDFKVIDYSFMTLLLLCLTPVWTSLGCMNTWNVDISFEDNIIKYQNLRNGFSIFPFMQKNIQIPYINIKRVIAVKNKNMSLQHREGEQGIFQVIPVPILTAAEYEDLKKILLEKNPDVYIWEIDSRLKSFSPPKDKKWPTV